MPILEQVAREVQCILVEPAYPREAGVSRYHSGPNNAETPRISRILRTYIWYQGV